MSFFIGRPLSGAEIQEIVRTNPRHPGYSFVITGPCQISLLPARGIGSSLGLLRNPETQEEYLPYLRLLHIYDPDTGNELPRIRLYRPATVRPSVVDQWVECFRRRPIVISVKYQGEPLQNAIVEIVSKNLFSFLKLNINVKGETDSRGLARFYDLTEGTYTIKVSASGYQDKILEISVPPYLHVVTLEKIVEKNYLLRFLIMSMNYMDPRGEAYFEIEMVIPMHREVPKINERETGYAQQAMRLSEALMLDYGLPEAFISRLYFKLGEEERILEVDSFITPTEAQIIDSQYNKLRAVYEVSWREDIIQTFDGESLHMNYGIKYTNFRNITKASFSVENGRRIKSTEPSEFIERYFPSERMSQ